MTQSQLLADLWAMLNDPKVWLALGWLFSTAVGTMPIPPVGAKPGYCWLYNFLQAVAANRPKVVPVVAKEEVK